jgi:hypothetical protein
MQPLKNRRQPPPERMERQVETVTTEVVLVTAPDASRVRFLARENAGATITPRARFGNRFAGAAYFFPSKDELAGAVRIRQFFQTSHLSARH